MGGRSSTVPGLPKCDVSKHAPGNLHRDRGCRRCRAARLTIELLQGPGSRATASPVSTTGLSRSGAHRARPRAWRRKVTQTSDRTTMTLFLNANRPRRTRIENEIVPAAAPPGFVVLAGPLHLHHGWRAGGRPRTGAATGLAGLYGRRHGGPNAPSSCASTPTELIRRTPAAAAASLDYWESGRDIGLASRSPTRRSGSTQNAPPPGIRRDEGPATTSPPSTPRGRWRKCSPGLRKELRRCSIRRSFAPMGDGNPDCRRLSVSPPSMVGLQLDPLPDR